MNISLSDLIAPHHCISCGELGAILCEYCKYDINEDGYEQCIVCQTPTGAKRQLCSACTVPYSVAWCVGTRHEALRKVLDDYKFERVRVAGSVCGELLDMKLPVLPEDTRVTYVTTTPSHIRRRGYDHAKLIAKDFAKRRGLHMEQTIVRTNNKHQFGASRDERRKNAESSIAVQRHLSPLAYLLIDDIYTTGATVDKAARELKARGASEVFVAIVARQPLEK